MNNTIFDFCEEHDITIDQFYGKQKIEDSLYLRSLTTIPENFNPTVGGSLDLDSLTTIPENFNPTVGGYLDLSSLTTIPENFNPTVGGKVYLSNGLTCNHKELPENNVFTWQNGKYIKVDGMFIEVVNKRGNVYHVRKINNDNILYLITDGEGRWSHGNSLKEAKEDLIYKISNRKKEDYLGIS